MTRADFVIGLVLAAVFGAVLWEASSFQYSTEFAPGTGFAPVWLSSIGIVLSLLVASNGRKADNDPRHSVGSGPDALDKRGLLRVGAALVGLVAMVLIVPWLGLALSILVFLLFLTLGVQRLSFITGVAASLATSCFIYLVFVYLLNVPVPTGPLGF